MAEVIPSGVIKLPNFAEIGYNLKRQKTQDALRAEEFSSQFDEIQGNYLAADVDAVQGAYDAVEDARDLYSQDPNNVDYIKALRKAHSYYAKIAGTAKFIADNNRSLSSDYNANPNKYSITSIDAFDLLEKDRSVKRTAEQIILLGQNPLEFGMSYKSDIADPNKAISLLLESFDRKKNDYMTAEGNYDLDKVRKDFKKIMENRSYLPEEKQGAILYQAFEKDLIGDRSLRNPIRPIDVDLINEPIFQEQNPNLFNDYMDGVVNSAMNFVAEQGVSPYAKAQSESEAVERARKEAQKNKYKDLEKSISLYNLKDVITKKVDGKDVKEEKIKGQGLMYNIASTDLSIEMENGDILVRFGAFKGKPYIAAKVEDDFVKGPDGEPIVTLDNKFQRAYSEDSHPMTAAEESALRAVIPNFDELMAQAIEKSKENKPSDNTLGTDDEFMKFLKDNNNLTEDQITQVGVERKELTPEEKEKQDQLIKLVSGKQ
jgi:hypothetical protein